MFKSALILFQCFPENSIKLPHSFLAIDTALEECGFIKDQRAVIYKIIASILFLEQITFEQSSDEEECHISSSSLQALENIAHLLEIDTSKIKNILLNRYINMSVKDSEIRFVECESSFQLYKLISMSIFYDFRIPLNYHSAKRARDSLAKSLYDHLFRQIVAKINSASSLIQSKNYIVVLDIAGFGKFRNPIKIEVILIYTFRILSIRIKI